MAKITSIRLQKNKKRFNIFADNKFRLALSAEGLVKTGLKVDQEISEDDIRRLGYKDIKNKLYERVLKFLSFRPRSEKEVRDYLQHKRHKTDDTKGTKGIVEEIISKLKKQKLVDDKEFAQWWVEQRRKFRPRGKIALEIELKQKGIEPGMVKSALEDFEEKELAKKLWKRNEKKYRHLSPFERKRKVSQSLQRRGFSWQTIQDLLEEMAKKG